MRQTHKQRGGTFLGIIIGLVIGLGIALAVAVVINKSPVPFTTKMLKQEKTASATSGQVTDPNKPLYPNKPPAAQKDFIKEAEKTLPPSAPADKKSAAKAEAPQQATPPVTAIDPAKKAAAKDGQSADAKSSDSKDGAKETAAKDDTKWQYYLQAGAFRQPNDAEATRAKLALLGVEAQISERQSENGTLYRVRIGPFAQLDAMTRVRGKLSDNGVDAAVVRTYR